MCSVEKMLVRGIRAFSPHNEDAIEFFKPLTIIVGPNGSGKTTVIECLKQACTGTMPPGVKKGAAFIHDPNLSKTSETRAQIKLRLIGADGSKVVVLKQFLATVKGQEGKTKMEFKATDQTLKTLNPATNVQEALTLRVSDIEKEVPARMGVSKAVLENVIFVHQEESNWPLGENLQVKKKFDEIFNLSGYIKAMAALKKIRLEYTHEVEKCKLKVENLQTHMEHITRLREDNAKDGKSVEGMRRDVAALASRMQRLADDVEAAEARLASHRSMEGERAVLRTRHEVLVESQRTLLSKLDEEAEEDVEELLRFKHALSKQLNTAKFKAKELESELNDLREQEEEAKGKRRRNETEESRLVAEIDLLRKEQRDMRTKSGAIASKRGLPFPSLGGTSGAGDGAGDGTADGAAAEAMTDLYMAMKKQLRRREADLASTKADVSGANQRDVDAMQKVQAEVYKHEEKIAGLRERKSRTVASIEEVEVWRASLAIDESTLHDNEAKDEALSLAVRNAEHAHKAYDHEERVSEVDPIIARLERKVQALKREKDSLHASSSRTVLFDDKCRELEQLKSQLKQAVDKNRDDLNKLFPSEEGQGDGQGEGEGGGGGEGEGGVPPPSDLYDRIHAKLKASREAKEACVVAGTGQESERQALDATIAATKRALSELEEEVEARASVVEASGLGSAESMASELAAAEADLGRVVDKIGELKAMKTVIGQYQTRAPQMEGCPVCKRPFGDADETHAFVHQQRQVEERIPDMVIDLQQSKGQIEKRIKAIRTTQGTCEELFALRAKAEAKRNEVEESVSRRATLAEAMRVTRDRRVRLAEAESLAQIMFESVGISTQQKCRRIDAIAKEVDAMREADKSLATAKTLTAVSAELEAAEASLKTEVERRAAILSHNAALYECVVKSERALREHRQAIAKAEGQALELKARLKEVARWKQDLEGIKREREECAQRIKALASDLQSLSKAKDAAFKERGKTLEAAEAAVSEFSRETEQMQGWCKKLAESDLEGKQEQLGFLRDKIASDATALGSLAERTAAVSRQIEEQRRMLSQRDSIARSIDDNIAYKRSLEEEARVRTQLDAMDAQIAGLGDVEGMVSEAADLRAKHADMSKRENIHRGSIQALESKIRERSSELNTPRYKNMEAQYTKQSEQVKTMGLAISDITNYMKAVDRAIVSFHTRKLANINKTMKEMWQKTYRNSDIDYIQVKSESEGRGHNYRVVMVSGGTEMDMRGRCSAGQRVLASIIIRMALAETFCIDCGILALDEPTTNLDEENARSLATMLQTIIASRSTQENFQLIVITHDESFAQLIGKRQYCEKYWYIHKDEDQYSRIKLQAVID